MLHIVIAYGMEIRIKGIQTTSTNFIAFATWDGIYSIQF